MPTQDMRVAVVSGGAAGIGKACARRFAAEGWAVLIGDMSAADGRATAEALGQQGARVRFIEGNVASEGDCQAMANAALDEWGRIDALVANAGARVYGSILDASDQDWQTIVGVNLRGVANCCKAVLPAMISRHSGSIVIVSSVHALVGRADMPLYDATKAAALSLTRSLAVAHGPDGVRVNAVCPGFTITDFHVRRFNSTPEQIRAKAKDSGLLGGPADPSEIAAAVYFMAGTDSSHITGQTLMVDGGMSARSGGH